jgi:hypothetical protein
MPVASPMRTMTFTIAAEGFDSANIRYRHELALLSLIPLASFPQQLYPHRAISSSLDGGAPSIANNGSSQPSKSRVPTLKTSDCEATTRHEERLSGNTKYFVI